MTVSPDESKDIMPNNDFTTLDRRTYLTTVGALAGAASLAGCPLLERGENTDRRELSDHRARKLAERFAPTLYFDQHEQWFPTDPRPYEITRDGESVVDGFAALDGYTDQAKQSDGPPAPTLFYHAVEYENSPLAVVQFWWYSAFDQFTTNFHWHDWEVLHVFIDTDTGDPQLYVASSHSDRVPNNEYLAPDSDHEPRILSELGSHSSALSVNDVANQFQRFSIDGVFADITNSAIEGITDIPLAYGLPRDEGARLPYLVPELDGVAIYDHDRLPSVGSDDLVSDVLTVDSFEALLSPPTGLPERSTGLIFTFGDRDTEADIEYDLVHSGELEHISAFTGPQLGFEFAVPEFAEDAIATHITTTSVPWNQPRYADPAEDISDPDHHAALAARYDAIGEPAPINTLVARVTATVTDDEAPEDEGVTTESSSVEAVALLESEPEAVPTFGGLVVAQDVPAGEHRLTVNGPGVEPHSESVAVGNDDTRTTTAGIAGEIPLVARKNAAKLEVNADGTDADLTDLTIEDDFAGRLYDSSLSGPDAVYLHRGGAYTTEVRDSADEIGAFRVNPTDETRIRIEEPQTGKGSLAAYIAAVAEETSAAVATVDDHNDEDGSESGEGSKYTVQGLVRALEALAEVARRTVDRADSGDRNGADESLSILEDRLEGVSSRHTEAGDDLPEGLDRAIGRRLDQLRRRAGQAQTAEKL